jgi:hypothetical protein
MGVAICPSQKAVSIAPRLSEFMFHARTSIALPSVSPATVQDVRSSSINYAVLAPSTVPQLDLIDSGRHFPRPGSVGWPFGGQVTRVSIHICSTDVHFSFAQGFAYPPLEHHSR